MASSFVLLLAQVCGRDHPCPSSRTSSWKLGSGMLIPLLKPYTTITPAPMGIQTGRFLAADPSFSSLTQTLLVSCGKGFDTFDNECARTSFPLPPSRVCLLFQISIPRKVLSVLNLELGAVVCVFRRGRGNCEVPGLA